MIKHRISRINGKYQIFKFFVNQHTKKEHWVAKRRINQNDTMGSIERYERLYKVVEIVRSEPNGEKSQIELCATARNHLYTIGFKDVDIGSMIGNSKEEKQDGKNITALS